MKASLNFKDRTHINFRSRIWLQTAILWLLGLIGYLFCELFASISLTLSLFTIYCFSIVVMSNDRSFINPLCIFTLFYYPYSTWFTYYSLLVGGIDTAALLKSVQYFYLGILAFSFVGILFNVKSSSTDFARMWGSLKRPRSLYSASMIMLVCSLAIYVAALQIAASGAASKRDVIESGNIFVQVAIFLAFVLTVGALIYLIERAKEKSFSKLFFKPMMIMVGCAFLAGFLFFGERDFVFRFAFCIIALYFSFTKNASTSMLFGVLVLLVLILPITQSAKGLLLPGSEMVITYELADIFFGEFLSASRNLYMLVHHGVEHSYSYLISDVMRGVVPLSGQLGFTSAGAWYDEVYRVEHGFWGTSGWGFTIVGLGYLMGGAAGIVIVMCIVSFILNGLYQMRNRSIYWFVFYLIALASTVYCIRADLANLFSQVFKIGGLSVLLYWLFHVFFVKLNSKNKTYFPISRMKGVS